MTWFRMPLFLWSMYATSVIFVLGTPVLAITMLLIAVERLFQFGFFDPALGGDPVLFQHLFWFYSHPAVYIMVLPAMGVVSELVAAAVESRCLATHSSHFPASPSRVLELPRVGTPYVRCRRVRVRGAGLFGFQLSGGDPISN